METNVKRVIVLFQENGELLPDEIGNGRMYSSIAALEKDLEKQNDLVRDLKDKGKIDRDQTFRTRVEIDYIASDGVENTYQAYPVVGGDEAIDIYADMISNCDIELEPTTPAAKGALSLKGDKSLLDGPIVAILGTRHATSYGLSVATEFGKACARNGLTVGTLAAVGCEAAAARGALDAGGKVVVFSPVGTEGVYPASSADIFNRAQLIASLRGNCAEMIRPHAFAPARNALIEHSSAVAVAEIAGRSRLIADVAHAEELGLPVATVPASIYSGTNNNVLIANGATALISSAKIANWFESISSDYSRTRQREQIDREPLINVLKVEPGQPPQNIQIPCNLNALQKAVGGDIQVVTPFENELENVALICNEDGKVLGLPMNRYLPQPNLLAPGDYIAGTFLLAAVQGDGFTSMTEAQAGRLMDMFQASSPRTEDELSAMVTVCAAEKGLAHDLPTPEIDDPDILRG